VPLVLRPDGGKYTLVGECYIPGIMEGEALIEERKKADSSYDGFDRSWLNRLHEEPIPFETEEIFIM